MREIELLGPVRAEGVSVTSPTQRLLISVLAAAKPDAVPFHRLVEAVWDEPPRSAANSLHSHLTRLRKILGADSIVRDGVAYRLMSPTDAERFSSLIASNCSSAEERRGRLSVALALWRGEPFGVDADHRFVRRAADALVAQHVAARRDLASLDLAAGDLLGAVAVLQQLVTTHPLDEANWSLLIEALDASGRRAEALRAVGDARNALAEVGLELSDRLRDAELAALRGVSAGPAGEIPRTSGPLVGRQSELARIRSAIAAPGWTTLVGSGGAGKTRLALEVAAGTDIPTWFVDLTDAAADELAVTIARGIGTPLRPPYVDRVIGRLSSGSQCLLLDCCETISAEVAALGELLLARCPELSVLATSRAPVGVRGEHLVEVEPLAVTYAGDLLRLRAEEVGINPPDDAETDALCRAVDCLPLNIEFLAGELRIRSPEELLASVHDPLTILGGPTGTMAASVERSISMLSDVERSTFEQLSMFRSPFTVEMAVACSSPGSEDSTRNHLRRLRDRSLLSSVDTAAGRRLRMLDTVRAVAQSSIDRQPGQSPRGRYVAAFADRARGIEHGLRSPDEMRWLQIAELEIVDLRAAHRLAIAVGDADTAMQIATSLFTLVYDRLRADLAAWADEALDQFGFGHELSGAVAAVAALGAMHVDDHDRAWSILERAASSETGGERFTALVAANLHLRDGDLHRTERDGQRVVDASTRAGDAYLTVVGHVLRGLSACYQGAFDSADRIATGVRVASRRIGAPTLLAYADYLDGEVRSETEPEVALEFLHRAYERAVACRSRLAEGVALVTITTIRARSDHPEAIADFAKAIRHWRDCGDWNLQWSTLRNFVDLLARTGRYEQAAELIGAIQAHGPAAFGPEATRFDSATAATEDHLGRGATERLRSRGRTLSNEELLDQALTIATKT